jgi:flagellar P-ring protein precursor FlgI
MKKTGTEAQSRKGTEGNEKIRYRGTKKEEKKLCAYVPLCLSFNFKLITSFFCLVVGLALCQRGGLVQGVCDCRASTAGTSSVSGAFSVTRTSSITRTSSVAGDSSVAGVFSRIKDLAHIQGVRENQLIGYGLLVGLNGTGDKGGTQFTVNSLSNMLRKLGVSVDPGALKVKNVAAVIVTATLPPFARKGERIDVTVSSLGDATSLQGGTLLLTPLKGADNQVYAVAQGPLSVGGFAAGGWAGGGVQKNHPTAGRIPQGASVEREIAFSLDATKPLLMVMDSADFITAARIARKINDTLKMEVAHASDPRSIYLTIPPQFQNNLVELVATVQEIEVEPDTRARVVINERTGTVVVGENVHISTVAISQGNLSIEIKENPLVSQPLPFSRGETQKVPQTDITVHEEQGKLIPIPANATVGELVKALNAIGVTSRDLIAILQSIRAAGALHAELEII